jgi:hypothetical protein
LELHHFPPRHHHLHLLRVSSYSILLLSYQ